MLTREHLCGDNSCSLSKVGAKLSSLNCASCVLYFKLMKTCLDEKKGHSIKFTLQKIQYDIEEEIFLK